MSLSCFFGVTDSGHCRQVIVCFSTVHVDAYSSAYIAGKGGIGGGNWLP